MGKTKRKMVPGLQDLIDRPICYYCEKDFEDLAYLIDHQRAKHYKCDRCNRRLNTAGGLSVHMSQVHKEKLDVVANALEGREKPDIEIFGMEGFPPDMLEAHKQRVTNEYFRREAEHRAKTGNPPPGAKGGPEGVESKQKKDEDTKKRIAEFKAKKAAAKAAAAAGGLGSGENTPGVSADSPQPSNLPPSQNAAPPIETPQSGHVNPGWPAAGQYNVPSHSPPPNPFDRKNTRVPVPAFPARQNSLPSAPGLPQRPAFDSPSISKEDMARIHTGHPLPPTAPPSLGAGSPPVPGYGASASPFGAPNPACGVPPPQWGMAQPPNGMPPGAAFSPNQSISGPYAAPNDIKDQVDELIASITSGASAHPAAPTQQPLAAVPQPQATPHPIPANIVTEESESVHSPAPVAKPSKKKEKKDKDNFLLKYSDDKVSPEEKRARKPWQPPQEWKDMMANRTMPSAALSQNSLTVVDQANDDTSQAVTGPVDDAIENDVPMD